MSILGASPNFKWLMDLMSLVSAEVTPIPSGYRDKVLAVKKALLNDESGVVASMLDFAVDSAVDVDYKVETNNKNLSEMLNTWLGDINSSLRGKVPVGIDALAKEYFRERWKGSSQLLLRSKWEIVDGYYIPTKLWFADGEDIVCESPGQTVTIGNEKYYLRVNKNDKDNKSLPAGKDEMIFIQKPYSSWGETNVTPFLIQRGLYKNMKMMSLLIQKGEYVVAKAMEYLLMVKKGTESLAKEGRAEFIYDKNDLDEVRKNFSQLMNEAKTKSGTPTYTTNFDTEIEHVIPDYERVLKASLFGPVEKRILAGLGLVDIVEGTTSSRREAILNPKPFIGEINSGVKDFKALITDLLVTIIEKNKNKHKKYFSDGKVIKVHSSAVKAFSNNDTKQILRSLYDRGILSKRTFAEVVGEVDFDMEVERREAEKALEKLLYPPVIQNVEKDVEPSDNPEEIKKTTEEVEPEDVTDDKKSIEKKTNNSSIQYMKNVQLPEYAKVLPAMGQSIWRKAFNSAVEDNDIEMSNSIAWSAVRNVYKKNPDTNKWTRKSKLELAKTLEQCDAEELIEMKKIEVLGKQSKILDRFIAENKIDLKENKNETT